jgi:tetratricopeptide (TPR) repeat protein
MKLQYSLVLLLLSTIISVKAQSNKNREFYSIDSLFIQGEYGKTIDLCLEILRKDSLNPDIYYKMGLAYQNLLLSDKSLGAFNRAVALSPENNKFNFALGKYYYNTGKLKLAEPIFVKLCTMDSLNWVYSYFLSDIFMQKGNYQKILPIYSRFYSQDTTNLMFLDKIGYCYLRMGELDTAQVLFEKSLSTNYKNIPSLKNLSYIYYKKNMIDTALYQLNQGIKYDSTDMDLYSRRADIYYSLDYHFRARPDYLRILASGDSSKLVLKRVGIGLAYNDQPTLALKYLHWAFQKDSSDFEIISYLGQMYYKLKQYGKSILYYNKVLELLKPIDRQIDYTNNLLADSYRDSCLYDPALKLYKKSLDERYSIRICMTIANIYDEKLKDYDKAIQYYQLFLNTLKENEVFRSTEYTKKVRDRLNWLVENKKKNKK